MAITFDGSTTEGPTGARYDSSPTGSADGAGAFEHSLLGGNHDFSSLESLGSPEEIKAKLDEDRYPMLSFEIDGKSYFLRKNASWDSRGEDVYQLFTSSGSMLDGNVRLDGEFTVDGFIEMNIGGNIHESGERLYFGLNDQGQFTAIVNTAELDDNDPLIGGNSHRQTLLSSGEVLYVSDDPVVEEAPVTLATSVADPAPTARSRSGATVSSSEITFKSNGGVTAFEPMSATEIREFLDTQQPNGGYPRLYFMFEGEEYYLQKNTNMALKGQDQYQAFTRTGSVVDMKVDLVDEDVNFDNNMPGDFVAISDLPGLGEDEAFFVGENEEGEFMTFVDKEDATEMSPDAVILENDPDAVYNPTIDGPRPSVEEEPAPPSGRDRTPSPGASPSPSPGDGGQRGQRGSGSTGTRSYTPPQPLVVNRDGSPLENLDAIGSYIDGLWTDLVANAANFAGSFQGAIEGMQMVSLASQQTDILINIASKVTSMTEKASGKVAS